MLECLILGDSIAVGTASVMRECTAYAHSGWNTRQWNKSHLDKTLAANAVIISLGSNDHRHIRTRDELLKLRNAITAQRVFWILPTGNLPAGGVPISEIQAIIKSIAAERGDTLIPITHVQRDGIHPSGAGYQAIATAIRK